MKLYRYEFLLEALSPIAHHSEALGNYQVLMRRLVRQPDGSVVSVPYITGDTMRHGLREAGALAYLEAAGLLRESLTEGALRLLFAGGQLLGAQGPSINLERWRELMELCPILALFGGAAENRLVPGKVYVEEATLICSETQHMVPTWCLEHAGERLESRRSFVEEAQRTRMDPTLDPRKTALLLPAQQRQVEIRLLMSEQASRVADADGKREARSSLMPHSYERIAQGALFSWAVEATLDTELEHDALLVSLAGFLANARVGGKKGTGCGRLRALAARGIDVLTPLESSRTLEPRDLGPQVGRIFREHVASRKDAIREFLASVVA